MSNYACEFHQHNGKRCNRQAVENKCCIFHTELDHEDRITDEQFNREIIKLIAKKDGVWEGFIFPSNTYLDGVTIEFPIYINDAKFCNLSIGNVIFNGNVELKECTFSGNVSLKKCEFVDIQAVAASFQGELSLSPIKVKSTLELSKSEFLGRFELRGMLDGNVNFNNAYFMSRVLFSHMRNLSISLAGATYAMSAMPAYIEISNPNDSKITRLMRRAKKGLWQTKQKSIELFKKSKSYVVKKFKSASSKTKNKLIKIRRRFPYEEQGTVESALFNGRVSFFNVVFDKPKLVTFHHVDLKCSEFGSTDLKGVSFIGCNWYQKKLGRNGIDSEHRLINSDFHARRLFLPRIESTCRSIRQALEENKDFNLANDFFIGEMEAQRQQLGLFKRHFFSLLAWYKAISNYGTSPFTCIRFFVFFCILHSSVILHEHIASTLENNGNMAVTASYTQCEELYIVAKYLTKTFGQSVVYSLQTMTLQREKINDYPELSYGLKLLNFFAALIGPALTLFLGLSIRTRIKRA